MKFSKSMILEFVAEFLATFLFAFLLFTAPMLAGGIEPFVLSFMVMALWYLFSSVAKVQMNPAVALGEYVVSLFKGVAEKKFYVSELVKFVTYLVVQFLAFLAAFPLAAWVRLEVVKFQMDKNNYGTGDDVIKQFITQFTFTNSYNEAFMALTFVLEMLMTFFVVFAFVRMANTEKFKQYTGMVWGLVIFGAMIMATQITGASFNPWKSLVAAMLEGGTAMSQVGLYVLAPFVGALLAGLVEVLLQWLAMPSKAKPVKVVKKVIGKATKTAGKGKRK